MLKEGRHQGVHYIDKKSKLGCHGWSSDQGFPRGLRWEEEQTVSGIFGGDEMFCALIMVGPQQVYKTIIKHV